MGFIDANKFSFNLIIFIENLANKLFGVLRSAGAIFAPDKRYY
jgi:hypothetical protein